MKTIPWVIHNYHIMQMLWIKYGILSAEQTISNVGEPNFCYKGFFKRRNNWICRIEIPINYFEYNLRQKKKPFSNIAKVEFFLTYVQFRKSIRYFLFFSKYRVAMCSKLAMPHRT